MTSARRDLLPMKLIPQFKKWLEDNGYRTMDPVGEYEALRFKDAYNILHIIHGRMQTHAGKATVHATVGASAIRYVHLFLNQRKEKT